jgi:1-acyl-sn-glycerol-3-phosphate acyltransferase
VRVLRAAVLLAYVTAKCVTDLIIYAVVFPLKVLSPRTFSSLTDFLYKFNVAGLGSIGHLSAPNTLLRMHGKIHDSGVARCVAIANHQSTADICMVGLLLHAFNFSNSMVWVMDRLLMYLPTGWTSLIHGDVFIVQSSQGGAPAIAEAAIKSGAANAWSLGRRCIMLYPEGGFFRKRHPRSVQWLKQQDPAALHPDYTALPRSGGFCNILGVVSHDFDGVLDITIRYERGGALAPEIPSLFMGTDEAIFLDVEWIPKRSIPAASDAAAVHTWLTQQFARKDVLMRPHPDAAASYTPISSVRARSITRAATAPPLVSPAGTSPSPPPSPSSGAVHGSTCACTCPSTSSCCPAHTPWVIGPPCAS